MKMKIFIFLSDKRCQEKIIKSTFNRDIKNASFICLNRDFQNLCNSFACKNFSKVKLPQLSNTEKRKILEDYVVLIGDIASHNQNSREWWASDISSKNRAFSPMQSILNDIIFSMKAIDECYQNSKDLFIFGAPNPVVEFIRDYAKIKKIEMQVNSWIFSNLFDKLKYFFTKQVYLFKSVISSLINMIKSKYYSGEVNSIDKDKPIFLIKSFVFPSAFLQGGDYKDLFFPGLEYYLKEKISKDIQVMTIVQGFSGRHALYSKTKNIRNRIVMPVENFLNAKDIIFAGMKLFKFWFFTSIKIPNNVYFLGNNISSTIRKLVSSYGDSILFGDYLYYYLARRIAKTYKLQVCYMTYEGNHWERMFVMGLKEVRPDIEIIGYQHAAISQSSPGIFISCKEIGVIPHPDRIITTGRKIIEVLNKNSCFPQDKIQLGCALRYQYLYSLIDFPIKKVSLDAYVILIVLSDAESSYLLLYAIKQAKLLTNINFIIRTHPILPLEQLLSISGISYIDLPDNMSVSSFDDVKNDIKRCDTVLYWNSTVSIEALMMGKSLICFDRGDVLSFDPMLFIDFDDLTWTVQSDMSISSIVHEIVNMKHSDLVMKVNKGRGYIAEYFSEKSEENMEAFIPRYGNISP
jgi:hypothetical protein